MKQNPLQIAAQLGRKPEDVTAAIRLGGIQPTTEGLRGGLYDIEDVTRILDAIEAVKQQPPTG